MAGVFVREPNGIPQQTAPYNAVRSLTAAAQRMRFDDPGEVERIRRRRAGEQWQDDAWEYYDAIGEIKYAFSLVGSVMSRVRLYTAYVEHADEPPVKLANVAELPPGLADVASQALDRLNSANGGQPGLLRDAAINLAVAGECYLVQTPAKPLGPPETWDIRSVNEVIIGRDETVSIKPTRTTQSSAMQKLPKEAFVGRIWRTHPRYTDESDSSMRALRDACDELLLLSRAVRATARSRLNAGGLFLPDGLSVSNSAPEDTEAKDPDTDTDVSLVDEEEDDFEQQLMESMTTPIQDEESASAVVPLIIRGPGELGDQIKQFKFERSFDPALAQRADRVLERILQGLDVPKDIVTGLANVKYSNATVIDESLYKAHIEPLVLLLCDAVTVVYYRPALIAAGVSEEEAKKHVIWYDPSEILTRPDRAQDSNDGFDRFALSNAAWRRAHGFSEADAPTAEEIVQRIAIVRGQMSPEITQAVYQLLVPSLMDKIKAESQAGSPAPIPPDVQQILDGGAPGAPPPPNGAPTPPKPPASPPGPPPAPENRKPPPYGEPPPTPIP